MCVFCVATRICVATRKFENGIFPEIIHTFSEITKVRANWEIDLKLTKKD